MASVIRNDAASRFEVVLDGVTATLAFERKKGRLTLFHSEVPEALQGRGDAASLEHAKGEGLEVVPFCPFVERYIQRHPEYLPLVAAPFRS